MTYKTISDSDGLAELCERIAGADAIAFDTEFVSEHTYRPQLCLVQVEAGGKQAVIDALAVGDLTPFWQRLAEGRQQTIVHAGREEIGFSLTAIGAVPAHLFDLQIAAGLIGLEYPAGYGSLAQKLLGVNPPKGETRTDWRKRPLSPRQLQYALNDVVYLKPMRDKLWQRLDELDRLEWLEDETERWIEHVRAAHLRDRWRRVSGISGLSVRGKAIIRELWQWREGEAQRRDIPVRRVLRDDLMIEIAKRQSDDVRRIRAVRGMDRGDLRKSLPDLAACVARAMALPEKELPQSPPRRNTPPQINVLGQFLSSALSSICRRADLAPSLVGNPSDVRDLIAYRLDRKGHQQPPLLAQGWRAEVVGNLIDELLAGRLSIRIVDPNGSRPLAFEPPGEAE